MRGLLIIVLAAFLLSACGPVFAGDGTVIDKEYTPADQYLFLMPIPNGKGTTLIPTWRHRPESFYLQVEICTDECRQRWITVTEEEYSKYEIGDPITIGAQQ